MISNDNNVLLKTIIYIKLKYFILLLKKKKEKHTFIRKYLAILFKKIESSELCMFIIILIIHLLCQLKALV